ncbi:hypothetical protein [Caldimonas brevitalea]|uniref:Uncharacterized protein n=1 Tax=Caldimonas brevitalea TaxID=413882 RepID=A0A0G3BRV3_9BURK|nr:hypothetical protein [Caldimonas brevitalea]AKJ32159.1 hypothetical protein AAW51_5468 [Caldimonas brevitalea]
MQPTTVELQVAPRDVAPRGAAAIATIAAWALHLASLPFRPLAGRPHAARVAHDLNCLAARYQGSQPHQAAELRAAAQAYLAAAFAR